MSQEPVEPEPQWGWRVIDAEGNVVVQGPLIEVTGYADSGEDSNGSD